MIDLSTFEAECQRDIPLLNAMQLSLRSYDNLTLKLDAPLAPNINNKGTAFGGSIASICLFAGWAVATLGFTEHGVTNTEIVVYQSEMTFLRPARGHLDVVAHLKPSDFRECLDRLQRGSDKRLRFDVRIDLYHDDEHCATMRGIYVVWLK
ncbi:MAG: thioesterase domain-containing protein [Gammaproteobacteria bacterium]|nr:thioesterase domain-containing protein [Gammaproteobacteria bacterium]